jgi:hypothetical protein
MIALINRNIINEVLDMVAMAAHVVRQKPNTFMGIIMRVGVVKFLEQILKLFHMLQNLTYRNNTHG